MDNRESRILILFFNNPDVKSVYFSAINEINGIQAKCVFKNVGRIKTILRKIHMKSRLFGKGIWFSDWKELIQRNKKVVCIASGYSSAVLKWIKKKEVSAKLINYYWDRIDIAHYPMEDCYAYENWSFCRQDCEQYQMKYNPQFYLHTLVLPEQEILYDISFVGSDRGGQWEERGRLVADCYGLFKGMGLSIFFYFISKADIVPKEIRKQEWLSEEEFNLVIARSKVILELVQPGKEWVTQRPLLALANGRKVITNNRYIKFEKYYSKKNIFILGVDDVNSLPAFVYSSFEDIGKDIMSFYNVETWSKRFFARDN